MAGRRIEIMFTDDEPVGRIRGIVCGQTCGPSLPASAAEFDANRERLQQAFQSVFDRGYEVGTANTQQSVKMALGSSNSVASLSSSDQSVAKLILVSPTTGHRLEVQSDLRTEGPFSVFEVGNRRESFEVRITMHEIVRINANE